MASSFTTNKSIEKPANGDYVNDWNVPVNSDWAIIDQAFGGTTTLTVTGVSGTVNLTSTQYIPLILNIVGTLTANVVYALPSGVGGQWIAQNNTTGAFTVTISSLGGGSSYIISQGSRANIVSDGTNVVLNNNISPGAAGSNTYVQYNSSGTTVGTAGLTFNGTTLTANALTVSNGATINSTLSVASDITSGGNITATGNVTAYSDANLKTDVTTIQNALMLVEKMRGVNYTRIDSGKRGVGVIAQEMQEVIPEVVHDTHGTLSVAYGNIVGVLIEAIKELSDKVAALESK